MPLWRHKPSQNAPVLYTLPDVVVGVPALMRVSLPLLVRMEDVVLVLHRHMAHVPAVGLGRVGRHPAVRFMVEDRVSPATGLRKALAVLLHDEGLRGRIRHLHLEGSLRALLQL